MSAYEIVKNPYFAIPLIISIAFGIISTIAFLQQRKKYKAQDYLFKLAEKHLNHDLTDEQIQAKKNELANILKSYEESRKKGDTLSCKSYGIERQSRGP